VRLTSQEKKKKFQQKECPLEKKKFQRKRASPGLQEKVRLTSQEKKKKIPAERVSTGHRKTDMH
jgi:hypothetical protein